VIAPAALPERFPLGGREAVFSVSASIFASSIPGADFAG